VEFAAAGKKEKMGWTELPQTWDTSGRADSNRTPAPT
jgi:hypothetical protein